MRGVAALSFIAMYAGIFVVIVFAMNVGMVTYSYATTRIFKETTYCTTIFWEPRP